MPQNHACQGLQAASMRYQQQGQDQDWQRPSDRLGNAGQDRTKEELEAMRHPE
jgi:hypothetical protein